MLELMCCESTLMREIADKGIFRKGVALTYALMLRSSDRVHVNIAKVNAAIIERWSVSGLEYIKNRAWAIAEGRIEP